MQYDRNGSLTNKTTGAAVVDYTYNLANRLSSVSGQGGTTRFEYNDQGIRVRSIGASATYYLVDANNHTGCARVLEEFGTLGTVPSVSYMLGDDVLGQGGDDPDEPRWLLYDGHGSTRQLVRGTAEVRQQYNYEAYGETLGQQFNSQNPPDTSLLICGEQLDLNLQMYNLRARYYNPATGTFNQRDTFVGYDQDPQSLHKYAYANCDPVNGVDPSGQFTMTQTLVTAGVIGILAAGLGFYLAHKAGKSKVRGVLAGAALGVAVGFIMAGRGKTLRQALYSGFLAAVVVLAIDTTYNYYLGLCT